MKRAAIVKASELPEVRRKIEGFRIIDLKTVLLSYHCKKDLTKGQLKQRLYSLIDGTELNNKEKEDLMSKIDLLSLQIKKTGENPYINNIDTISLQVAKPITTKIMENVKHFPINDLPIQPDVTLKNIPFYDIIGPLLPPSTLIPSNLKYPDQVKSFSFHLTPQQASLIEKSRVLNDPLKPDYVVQAILRLCLLEVTSEQADHFPQQFSIKVNSKACHLPNPLPARPGTIPRRPPKELNITPLIKASPLLSNIVEVKWVMEPNKTFVLSCYLVQKVTSDILLQRMKSKGIKPADFTRGLIKEKLNECDNEIATTMFRVSLNCPLGKMRMVTPCRASTCMHLQCMDASLYLQMNELKASWICPVCDKPILYKDLVIDGYFLDVINKLTADVHEIQLHKDGSWTRLDKKNEIAAKKVSSHKMKSIEISDDDTEDEIDNAKPKVKKFKSNEEFKEIKTKPVTETIDLTLDDD